MICHLFELQEEAMKLFFFLKTFLPLCDDLEGNEKVFSGYLLKLLVIFFLQSQKLLPSVETVQLNTPKEFIDGNYSYGVILCFSYYSLIDNRLGSPT